MMLNISAFLHSKRWLWATVLVVALTILIVPSIMAAETVTVTPAENDLVLNPGDSFNEVINVSIPAETGVSKADVYLLADTTGSMGGPINEVKVNASTVVDGLTAALPGVDLAFGVGDYKDFPYDSYAFNHATDVTTDTTAVKNAINNWYADGGYDGPEGQLFALDQLAGDTDPLGGNIGWRPDAKKIIVWFGDAPAHDSVCAAISGLPYEITEASVTTKLTDASITVIAISTLTGYVSGLDDDPGLWGGDYDYSCGASTGTSGQASRITTATGGMHASGIDASSIVTAITDMVTTAVSTINNVSLVPTGDTAPFVASISPSSYGPLNSDISHELAFEVAFNGVNACTDTDQVLHGTIDVVADGSVLAQKTVTITVPACTQQGTQQGRMTGGGTIISSLPSFEKVSHGMELHCDATLAPNNLQVNWGKGNKFHLESLVSASCSDDPAIDPGSPTASFDTHQGSGTGRYNGVSGATAEWTFTDAGEPGKNDTAKIVIRDASGNVVLAKTGLLTGNHQAHPDN
ncbi:MAG: hypothetical protein ACYC4D_03905 [Thermoleophilia bacterium]